MLPAQLSRFLGTFGRRSPRLPGPQVLRPLQRRHFWGPFVEGPQRVLKLGGSRGIQHQVPR
eukprot:9828204-Alexandrium_andersonii.AAC.1